MIITKRDIEAFTKMPCFITKENIYISKMAVDTYVLNGDLCFCCKELTGLLKMYLKGHKHITYHEDVFCLSHPMIKFDRLLLDDDTLEITFK